MAVPKYIPLPPKRVRQTLKALDRTIGMLQDVRSIVAIHSRQMVSVEEFKRRLETMAAKKNRG